MDFDLLVNNLKKNNPKKIVVAHAQDEIVLKAITKAYELGIAIPILCGDLEEILSLSRKNNLDVSNFEIIGTKSSSESVQKAISLIKEKKADVLMKGLLHTKELLREVLHKERGLKEKDILSHIGVMHSKNLNKTLFITDSAMVMYPDINTKIQLIENAILVAKSMGVSLPKVAAIAAVEVVNMDMQATIDGALLTVMNNRGQIKGCVIDGPLSFDVAISKDSAKHKGVNSLVAGEADILLFHNIEASNSTLKAMTYVGNCLMGGVIMGAKAPIVLTSRSDTDASKLYSIACALSIDNTI